MLRAVTGGRAGGMGHGPGGAPCSPRGKTKSGRAELADWVQKAATRLGAGEGFRVLGGKLAGELLEAPLILSDSLLPS